eukprot:10196173-Alexandrium_andersonii.AAC.1
MMAPLRKLKDFSLGDCLGEEEADGIQADGAGPRAVGLLSPGAAAALQTLMAVGAQLLVATGVLPAY